MRTPLAAALSLLLSGPLCAQTAIHSLSNADTSLNGARHVFDGDLHDSGLSEVVPGGGVAPFGGGAKKAASVLAPAAPAPASPVPQEEPKGPFPPRKFSAGFVGLFPQSDFDLTTGRRCVDCDAPKEGLWYFEDDVIAVPKNGAPGIVWIGSTELLEHVRLSKDGQTITLEDGAVVPFELTPKIESNRSFYNEATVAYFQDRPLRVRGEWAEKDGVKTFVARTIWPEDQRLDAASLKTAAAGDSKAIDEMVKQDAGGAKAPFSATILWKKAGEPATWTGKTAMGLMLNGAQGDDDEAQAGHFSMFTGRVGQDGGMADWMFDNFYDMDLYSEKGIIAGMVPMDKYMADVNSGQSYYRPTYMVVAVMKDESLARRIQDQFKARYAQYYSHAIKYDHTHNACTSLVVDVLRGDGWNYPLAGGSSGMSRFILSALAAAGSLDAKKYREMQDIMSQERTHLFPRAAFDSLSGDLVGLANGSVRRELTPFEKELKDGLEALLFVRLPQIPSSRAFGREAVYDSVDYFHRVPLQHSKWKTVPSVPRPYPPPH